MKIQQLLKYLKCPDCGDSGLLPSSNGIDCTKCATGYSVIEGVPVLINKDKLNDQEKHQLTWFDKHYSEFSDDTYRLENWRLSMLKRIFENDLIKTSVRNYLDIGCGATGYTVIESAKTDGTISIGTDISLEAMIRARRLAEKQKVGKRTAFIVCSAENLPFKDETFDYISAISILEHISNDEKVIMNISRMIKKFGFLYVCVPNTYKRMWFFLWPLYYFMDKKIGHLRHYSEEGLIDLLSPNRLHCKRIFYNGHLIKFYQIFLERLGLIHDKKWWLLEDRDLAFQHNKMGVQLNAIFVKDEATETYET